jgi:hypothetical protein
MCLAPGNVMFYPTPSGLEYIDVLAEAFREIERLN